MTEIGPIRVWPSSIESIAWAEDQPQLIVDLLATNVTGALHRHVLIPMGPDEAWQLVLLLQQALEQKGIPRPKGFATVVSDVATEEE